MLVLYTRLFNRPHPTSPQKNSIQHRPTNSHAEHNRMERQAHHNATDRIHQVKVKYSLDRRLIL